MAAFKDVPNKTSTIFHQSLDCVDAHCVKLFLLVAAYKLYIHRWQPKITLHGKAINLNFVRLESCLLEPLFAMTWLDCVIVPPTTIMFLKLI